VNQPAPVATGPRRVTGRLAVAVVLVVGIAGAVLGQVGRWWLGPAPWRLTPSPVPSVASPGATGIATAPPGGPTAPPWRDGPTPAFLAPARQLERDGDGAAAEATYRAESAGTGPAALVAAGELARRLADGGDPVQALGVLASAAGGGGPDALPPPARLVYAQQLAAAGRADEALAAYASYVQAVPAMAGEVAMSQGQLLFELGRFADALPFFDAVLAAAPDAEAASLAHLRRGNALLRLGRTRESLAAYDAALAAAANDPARAQALAGRIGAQAALGDLAAANADRLRLVREVPAHPLAAAALARLQEAGVTVAPDEEANVRLGQGDPAGAIALIEAARAGRPDYPLAWDLALARAHIAAHEDQQAVDTLTSALARRPDDPVAPAAALLRAETLAELDRSTEAATAYGEAGARWPAVAGDALWARALLLDRAGDPAAGAAYAAAADASGPRAAEARFRAGLAEWVSGRADAAAGQWQRLTTEPDARTQARARYWLGRSADRAGDAASAGQWWTAVRALDPTGYYGLRAAQRLGQGLPVPLFHADDAAATGSWLATWRPGQGADAWARTRADAAARPEVARAAAWLSAGRPGAATADLLAAGRSSRDDPAMRAALAWEAARLGATRGAMALAEGVLAESPDGALAPGTFQRLAFPDAYGAAVRAAAAAQGLPPALLFALVRQESRFEPAVRSTAGAIGLTQVMPDTGQHLADRLGLTDFVVDDLSRPEVSLRLGAAFLRDLLANYDGQAEPALAGYNGGPGNAGRWWSAAGGDPDLLVERIDFPETASYVRKVLEQRAAYERLYPDLR
jgi:soluble lytic murein transglycosylase